VEGTKSKKSILDVAIRVLYQFMLTVGVLIVVVAIYLIKGGTLAAIFMIIPGLLTLGGGIVLRQISGVSKFA